MIKTYVYNDIVDIEYGKFNERWFREDIFDAEQFEQQRVGGYIDLCIQGRHWSWLAGLLILDGGWVI